jgi:hypothetical protein
MDRARPRARAQSFVATSRDAFRGERNHATARLSQLGLFRKKSRTPVSDCAIDAAIHLPRILFREKSAPSQPMRKTLRD